MYAETHGSDPGWEPRWARLRNLDVGLGYEAGVKALKMLIEFCCKWGIRVLTVFAFSTDNWFHPKVSFTFFFF